MKNLKLVFTAIFCSIFFMNFTTAESSIIGGSNIDECSNWSPNTTLNACTSANTSAKKFSRLKLYWSNKRGDNFSTSTAKGEKNAKAAGYRYARTQGYLLTRRVRGTVALKLYWSSRRGDNFTASTAKGERAAKAAGYRYAGIEGYLYTRKVRGTVALKLYWSSKRGDNFSTSTAKGDNY